VSNIARTPKKYPLNGFEMDLINGSIFLLKTNAFVSASSIDKNENRP
jgi:hypothetical protein